MSKYVMVNAISMFSMKYCVEVPDDIEPGKIFDHVEKQVKDENVKEFSQRHMGESVANYDVVTLEEACDIFRNEEPYFAEWSDEIIIKNNITPIGFDHEAYYEEEEKQWRKNMS